MANKDLYAVLGVARDSDADAIKKAFRKLATQHHPDKNPGDAKAEARFKEVSHANDVLGDAKKRALYDEFGEDGLREGFNVEQARAYKAYQAQGGGRARGSGSGGVNIEDLFGGNVGAGAGGIGDILGDMFGGRAQRGGGRRRTKGRDVEGEVTIDFAESVRGTTVQLKLENEADPITVRVPPGATEGVRIRVAGHGESAPSPNGTAGDLLLTIHVRAHAHFKRDGDDLHLDLPLTIAEAYLGAKVRVPTFDGGVTMKVPPHTQSGQQMRLRGKGIPRRGGEPGDLYVHFLVRVPTTESEALTKAIATIAEAQSDDVRAGIEA
jgi:curved DNA-binding protein